MPHGLAISTLAALPGLEAGVADERPDENLPPEAPVPRIRTGTRFVLNVRRRLQKSKHCHVLLV